MRRAETTRVVSLRALAVILSEEKNPGICLAVGNDGIRASILRERKCNEKGSEKCSDSWLRSG